MRTLPRRALALAILAAWPLLAIASDPALVGRWQVRDLEDGTTSELAFNADGTANLEGSAVRYTVPAPGIARLDFGGFTLDWRYSISGNTLSIDSGDGEQFSATRIGAPPPVPPPPAGGGNPLAPKPAAAGLAGTYKNEAMSLAIEGTPSAYRGTLNYMATDYPIEATGSGDTISGTFTSGPDSFAFSAVLVGSTLKFKTEGFSYDLERVGVPAPAAKPKNPLAGGAIPPPPSGAEMFRAESEGFEFPLAGGFFAGQPNGGATPLGSNTTPGLVIVRGYPGLKEADIAKVQAEGFRDDSLQLTLSSAFEKYAVPGGTGWRAPFRGTLVQDGTPVVGLVAAAAGEGGTGVVIVALTTDQAWPQLRPVAEEMARGIRMIPRKDSPELAVARGKIAGLALSYVSSTSTSNTSQYSGQTQGGLTSTAEAFYFCRDGSFRYEGMRDSSFSHDVALGSSSSATGLVAGKWNLSQQGDSLSLTLTWDNGENETREIFEQQDGKVRFGSRSYKVVRNEFCP